MKRVARLLTMSVLVGLASCEMNDKSTVAQKRAPATNPVAAIGDEANYPPPGTMGNAANVPYIGGNDPGAPGRPVRLARRSGHVSNYDESKIKPYTLPELLVTDGGRKVTTADQWIKQRRPEILRHYQTEIYGEVPKTAPKVTWAVVATDQNAQNGTAIAKQVVGTFNGKADGPKINMTVYTPKNATGPVPIMLSIGFAGTAAAAPTTGPGRGGAPGAPTTGQARGRRGRGPATAVAQADGAPATAPATGPARGRGGAGAAGGGPGGGGNQIAGFLSNGWGYATIGNGDIQADNNPGLAAGVIAMSFEPGQTERKPQQWGSIAAWAWGISRCVDYFETDKSVNAKQVSITGASRLGKTVLWAGASDERIAGVCSIVSGEMGAALIRRDWGETLDDMAQNYPWQFAGNLQKYVGRWDDLPIDNHMLIALVAPRMVYVNGGVTDQWSDPEGEYLSMVAAGQVYKLLGKKDLGPNKYEIDKPMIDGDMGFLYHSGGHQAVAADWVAYREFADRHFKAQGTK